MNQDMVIQLIRYALLTAGPAIAQHGWATDAQWESVVGAAITIITWAWGVYVKWNTTSVPSTTAARPDVPTVSPVTGATQ